MTDKFFQHVKGGSSTYVGGDDSVTDCRRLLMFHGEDAYKCVEQFWKEHSGDFVIIPETGYSEPPRRELCTQRSLVAALQTLTIEPDGIVAQKWKSVCEFHNVAWPSRLSPKAA